MYTGTTPTFTLTLPEDVDLTLAEDVHVTFSSTAGKRILRKSGDDLEIDANIINVFLTQDETLTFPGNVLIQVNWTYKEGEITKRACSTVVEIPFTKNLLNEVI